MKAFKECLLIVLMFSVTIIIIITSIQFKILIDDEYLNADSSKDQHATPEEQELLRLRIRQHSNNISTENVITRPTRPPLLFGKGNISEVFEKMKPRWGRLNLMHNGRMPPPATYDDYVMEAPQNYSWDIAAEHLDITKGELLLANDTTVAASIVVAPPKNAGRDFFFRWNRTGLAEDVMRHGRIASIAAAGIDMDLAEYWRDKKGTDALLSKLIADKYKVYRESFDRELAHEAALAANWTRPPGAVLEDDAHLQKVRIRYGILGVARFVDTRLIPLLNTSLRDIGPYDKVDVFIRKTRVSYAVADYIRQQVRSFHPRWRNIRVVELYGPKRTDILGITYHFLMQRNAWQNLEILRFWNSELDTSLIGTVGDEEEHDRHMWYSVMDDDGYVFLDNAKAMLWDTEQVMRLEATCAGQIKTIRARVEDQITALERAFNASRANVGEADLGTSTTARKLLHEPTTQITDDEEHHDKVIHDFLLPPFYGGQKFSIGEHVFGNGGPGYYFTRAALKKITDDVYKKCLNSFRLKQLKRSGDAIAGACMNVTGIPTSQMRGLFNTGIDDRYTSEAPIPYAYPVAFHKVYGGVKALHLLYLLSKARREQGQLIHWEDIAANIRARPSELIAPTSTVAKSATTDGTNASMSNVTAGSFFLPNTTTPVFSDASTLKMKQETVSSEHSAREIKRENTNLEQNATNRRAQNVTE